MPWSPSAPNTGMLALSWTTYLQLLMVPFRFHGPAHNFLFKMLIHAIVFHYFILFTLYVGSISLSYTWPKNLKASFLSFSLVRNIC